MNIQYVSLITDDKDEAMDIKCKVRKNKSLYLKNDCSWSELKDLILHGCTIARVGTESEYIALDIDDSEVTHSEMKCWSEGYNMLYGDKVLVTKSISGKENKHHVYFKTEKFSVDQVKDVTSRCFSILAEAFKGKKLNLDKNAWSFWQCMFNVGDKKSQFILEGSLPLVDWCKKFQDPAIRDDVEEEYKFEEFEDEDVKISSGCLIPNHANHYFELVSRADLPLTYCSKLPFELVKTGFVKTGTRHFSMMKLVENVVRNFAVCQFFGEGYDLDDVRFTVESHIRAHYQDPETFIQEDRASIDNAISTTYEQYLNKFLKTSKTIDDLIDVLGARVHHFSIKSFAIEFLKSHKFKDIEEACIAVVDRFNAHPEEYDTDLFNAQMKIVRNAVKSLFETKRELVIEKDLEEAKRVYNASKSIKLFDNVDLPEMSFEEFCQRSTAGDKYSVKTTEVKLERKKRESSSPRSDRGKCIEGYEVEGDTVKIPRSEVTPAMRRYCSTNHLKITRI